MLPRNHLWFQGTSVKGKREEDKGEAGTRAPPAGFRWNAEGDDNDDV